MEPELFSEIYNCYFLVVRRILDEAAEHGLSECDLNRIADTYGYEESALSIVPKLVSGEWNLLERSGEGNPGRPLFRSRVKAPAPLPLTKLQRSWLKAISADPRFRLFFTDEECRELDQALKDIQPLFYPEDFSYFDRYSDGDGYTLDSYRQHFKTILEGIR